MITIGTAHPMVMMVGNELAGQRWAPAATAPQAPTTTNNAKDCECSRLAITATSVIATTIRKTTRPSADRLTPDLGAAPSRLMRGV